MAVSLPEGKGLSKPLVPLKANPFSLNFFSPDLLGGDPWSTFCLAAVWVLYWRPGPWRPHLVPDLITNLVSAYKKYVCIYIYIYVSMYIYIYII